MLVMHLHHLIQLTILGKLALAALAFGLIFDSQSVSIAVGATTNVLSGRNVEFITKVANLRLAITADAAGLTMNFSKVEDGNPFNPIQAGAIIAVASGAGQGPILPNDIVLDQEPVHAGARIALNITNPTAGAIVVRYRLWAS